VIFFILTPKISPAKTAEPENSFLTTDAHGWTWIGAETGQGNF